MKKPKIIVEYHSFENEPSHPDTRLPGERPQPSVRKVKWGFHVAATKRDAYWLHLIFDEKEGKFVEVHENAIARIYAPHVKKVG